jgi:hypothetical protein
MEFDDKFEKVNSISDNNSSQGMTSMEHSSNNCSQSAFNSSISSDICAPVTANEPSYVITVSSYNGG